MTRNISCTKHYIITRGSYYQAVNTTHKKRLPSRPGRRTAGGTDEYVDRILWTRRRRRRRRSVPKCTLQLFAIQGRQSSRTPGTLGPSPPPPQCPLSSICGKVISQSKTGKKGRWIDQKDPGGKERQTVYSNPPLVQYSSYFCPDPPALFIAPLLFFVL